MIGDIFEKLAKGEKLNEFELQQLKLWGNRAELNESFVSGMQNGSSDIHVKNIRAEMGEYRYAPSGYSSKFRSSETVAPTATSTKIVWDSIVYDNLGVYPGSGQTDITIKLTGKYKFVIWGDAWKAPAATTGYLIARLRETNGVMIEEVCIPFSTNFLTSFQFIGEASMKIGNNIFVSVVQTSGGDMDFRCSIALSLIKTYDNEVFFT